MLDDFLMIVMRGSQTVAEKTRSSSARKTASATFASNSRTR